MRSLSPLAVGPHAHFKNQSFWSVAIIARAGFEFQTYLEGLGWVLSDATFEASSDKIQTKFSRGPWAGITNCLSMERQRATGKRGECGLASNSRSFDFNNGDS